MLVNLGSRSLTITLGNPCNLKISLKNIYAIVGASALVVVGIAWIILVRRSTNTTIASWPSLVLGN